ncbi:MAG: EscU/YscU/HrcU family type III secretion system export apparatus switch protein [Oleibacter sp.]|nr:EscU/YscU/HrcU family type III secretion system export apparatus switch protein [Thalassolituus sp.]
MNKESNIPEHLFNANQAIALVYDGERAPTISASGQDELAQAIIQLALQYEIPIYENAELAAWLSQLDIGEEIPEMLYRVIAEILAFVYQLEGREAPLQKTSK